MDIYKGAVMRNSIPIPLGVGYFGGEVANSSGSFIPDYEKATNIVTPVFGFPYQWFATEDGFFTYRFNYIATAHPVAITVSVNGAIVDYGGTQAGAPATITDQRMGGIVVVKKGDTVDIIATNATTPWGVCEFIPPRTVISPEAQEFSYVPDYSARETVYSAVPVPDSTLYTVAKDGFLSFDIRITGTTDATNPARTTIRINGSPVFFSQSLGANATPGAYIPIPVKAGDVISIPGLGIGAFSESNIYYFPPRIVIPPTTEQVAFVPDYANIEPTLHGLDWTAGRDGFVECHFSRSSYDTAFNAVAINGTEVYRIAGQAMANTRTLLPVRKNDRIVMTTSGSGFNAAVSGMRFIPPVAVIPPTINAITTLADGTDFNNVLTPGDYVTFNADSGQTMINAPVIGRYNWTITVSLRYAAVGQGRFQIAKTRATSGDFLRIFARSSTDAGWDNWQDISGFKNAPNLWPVGIELDFGDGSFGQRFTGNITAAADTNVEIPLATHTSIVDIVDCGGSIHFAANSKMAFGHTLSVSGYTVWGTSSLDISGMGMRLQSRFTQARSNMPYNIWVIYSKA